MSTSDCIPKANVTRRLMVAVVISILGGGFLGYFVQPSLSALIDPPKRFITPIIDGVIDDEWSHCDLILPYFINVNNTPHSSGSDVDTYNYVYIGQDVRNLYIAVDLCGDQTDDPSYEYIFIGLNLNRTYDDGNLWNYVNDGYEHVGYHVDDEEDFIPFFVNMSTPAYSSAPYVLEYAFTSSPNCDEDHRIFEFAIPISGLEGYTSTTKLGFAIQGYGTMAAEGYNFYTICASGDNVFTSYANGMIYVTMGDY